MSAATSRSTRAVVLSLGVPAVAVLALAAGVMWWYRVPLRDQTPVVMRPEPSFLRRIDDWAAAARRPPAVRMVLFGDSLAKCKSTFRVGAQVEVLLKAAGIASDLLEVQHAAFRPLTYAYFLDEVLAGRPRVAVLEVNLGHLLPGNVFPRSHRFSAQVGRLALARAWRLRRALADDELTLLDPLVARVADRLDAHHLLYGLELMARDRLEAWGRAVNRSAGFVAEPPAKNLSAFFEGQRERAAQWSTADFTAHPLADALRELVTSLHAAGVWVLCYVSPLPPKPLRDAAWPDETSLAAGIDRLRAALGVAPDDWVDLHDLIPDAKTFVDRDGHMQDPGCVRIAEAVTPRLAAGLRSRAD